MTRKFDLRSRKWLLLLLIFPAWAIFSTACRFARESNLAQGAIDLAPEDTQVLRSLATFSLSNEYHIREVGLPAARQSVLLAPLEPASLDLMGQTLLQLGDHLTAERFLRRALDVNPSYAPAHLHLGWVYLLSGEKGRAYDQFQRAQALDPNSPTAEQAGRLLQNYFP